ncbi:hypothetical protein RclHR1_16870004 [Rhizophagus clarus]|uniref:Uncharacterized protein n=1 Tax=Rhizophagus clarus TaxID=94130 RepID=A0A2Z6RBH3_9GLOM|nr:hypothetical protein RclHR1_16870004 [Rhizophagus clarus]
MINPSLRRYMRSDATKLSSADYEDTMQYQDMKSKPLEQLRKKFHISTSHLYQIWRGQEAPIECNTIAESEVKTTGGKKTKSKSVYISGSPVIQIPLASKSLNISNRELGVFYEKEDKRDRKITEEVNRILAT